MEILTPPFKNDYPRDQVFSVPLSAINGHNPEFNSRGGVSPGSVVELAKEIKQKGLIQPITLQPFEAKGKAFRIVAGYRRFAAHQFNGDTHINALIRCDLTEIEARMVNLVENTQRQDLDLAQEAKSLKFFAMANWTDKEIGERVGKSPTWVRNRLDFLELPSDIQDEVVVGLIPVSEVRKILDAQNAGGIEGAWAYAKQLKTDKLTNKKVAREVAKTIKVNEKRIRTQEEIFAVQLAIQEATGIPDDILALVLGWAGGYVDDSDMYPEIQQHIRGVYDRYFAIPSYAVKKEEVVAAA